MAVIHISEAEASRDLTGIMLRVNAGDEVIINNGKMAVAMVPISVPARRSISECIALARKHEEETGAAPELDANFAADVEEIVNNRKPWNPTAWD